jgi:hypothetical protein
MKETTRAEILKRLPIVQRYDMERALKCLELVMKKDTLSGMMLMAHLSGIAYGAAMTVAPEEVSKIE